MVKEINLIIEAKRESEQVKKIKRIVGIGSPIALLIFAVFVMIVYSYAFVQSAKARDLNIKLTNTKNQIQQLSETESYLRGSKIKLVIAGTIFDQQIDYANEISHIQVITPPEANFTNLTISEDKYVDLSFRVPNSDVLTSLINSLLDNNSGGKYFDQVSLKTLSFSRDGTYQLSLHFHIK